MKAQNLAISIPKRHFCDKNCPYCVSKMTGYLEPNLTLFKRNLKKAKTLAKNSNITSVLITGKGEPTLEWDLMMYVIDEFNEFPLELQTNGKHLKENPEKLTTLAMRGLNVLAISIDHTNGIYEYKELIKKAQELGMLVRYTFNLTYWLELLSFEKLFEMCADVGIDQLSIREVSIPTDAIDAQRSIEAQNWIKKHVKQGEVSRIHTEMEATLVNHGRFLMPLPYGAKLYDLDGISVTWFDYCVQDSNEGDDIRSLIYQEDGHMYFTWNSKASRLF
jgi:molybdenum cofactor biosynthesis enzyme MoaA